VKKFFQDAGKKAMKITRSNDVDRHSLKPARWY